MKRTDLPLRYQHLLSRIPYITIATVCPDGRPWNSPVVGYFDDQLRLYWASDAASQHSLNLRRMPYIFAVVYDSSAPLGEGVGLYLSMRVRKLIGRQEINKAKEVYIDRYGETHPEPFAHGCPRRIYCGRPLAIWVNIDGSRKSHFVDKRQLIMPTLS